MKRVSCAKVPHLRCCHFYVYFGDIPQTPLKARKYVWAEKREYSLGIWISERELAQLKNQISKSNLNQSEYIRSCILNKKITVILGIRDLVIEVKRIGNNLNQLTRAVNQGTLKVLGDNPEQIRKDLRTVRGRLAETLSKI